MAAASKVQDFSEALGWLRAGRSYQWIVDEYVRKYGVQTTVSMWAALRRKHGLERRIVRNRELIPWQVDPQHRHSHAVAMLRAEGRRRAGRTMTPRASENLRAWLDRLERDGTVVHYDRATPGGWRYVRRREDIDFDLIREPNGRHRYDSHGEDRIAIRTFIVYDDGRRVPFDPLLVEAGPDHLDTPEL